MIIQALKCRRCSSTNLVKNGSNGVCNPKTKLVRTLEKRWNSVGNNVSKKTELSIRGEYCKLFYQVLLFSSFLILEADLWRTDGTSQCTTQIKNINQNHTSDIKDIVSFNN